MVRITAFLLSVVSALAGVGVGLAYVGLSVLSLSGDVRHGDRMFSLGLGAVGLVEMVVPFLALYLAWRGGMWSFGSLAVSVASLGGTVLLCLALSGVLFAMANP